LSDCPDPAPQDEQAQNPQRSGGAPKAGGQRLKLLLLVALVFTAAFAAWRVYEPSLVKWHLGTLRQDLANERAREGLRALGDKVYPYMREELRSGDADSRFVAILAVAALEGPEADRLLVRATADPDSLNTLNAVSALDDRGRAGATLGALTRLLEIEASPVRFAARRLSGRLTGIPWWAFGRDAADEGEPAATDAPEDS
jgi:hypothetical protein